MNLPKTVSCWADDRDTLTVLPAEHSRSTSVRVRVTVGSTGDTYTVLYLDVADARKLRKALKVALAEVTAP